MNSRYEKAKEKYLSDLDLSVIDQLAYCDPSKDHKYLDWMCDRLILRCHKRDMLTKYLTPGLQYVTDMCKLVKSFHENLSKFTRKNVESSSKGTWFELSDMLKLKKAPKDIYSYSTYHALEFYVVHISTIITKKDLRDIVHNETGVHYDDGEWKIITPFTTRASNYYGVGTKWCTSAKENNQFETYRVRGELYYIIGKRKVAYFHSHDEEECAWYNDIDNMVHYEDVSHYIPKEILDKVLEIDAEAFEEISLDKNERAYYLRVLRDLASQSNYMGMNGWRLEFENNGAAWINEKEEKLKLWVNPSHSTEEKLDWICVLVDSHFSHMIHADEWMMWDLDEITDRKWIPIDLDLTGDIKKDKMRIVSDFLFHSASMFSELEEFVELYTSNLPLNRQKHITKVGEEHLGWA